MRRTIAFLAVKTHGSVMEGRDLFRRGWLRRNDLVVGHGFRRHHYLWRSEIVDRDSDSVL